MNNSKNKLKSVMRTDLLLSNMTATKEAQLRDVLAAYQRGAVLIAKEQWEIFFKTEQFNKHSKGEKLRLLGLIGAANRVQMCRWQVVGQLKSWISNRANDFKEIVKNSLLDNNTLHMLRLINQRHAWFSRKQMTMQSGQVIPIEVWKLARSIMRQVMKRHSRPDLRNTSMWLDPVTNATFLI